MKFFLFVLAVVAGVPILAVCLIGTFAAKRYDDNVFINGIDAIDEWLSR